MPQPNESTGRLMRTAADDRHSQHGNSTLAGGETAARSDLKVDLCIIGAGSGGLSVAAAAAQLGVPVALIEKHRMGGDCLNYGCVPSKALIAAARRAHEMRSSGVFGISPVQPSIDHAAVCDHVHGVISAIAPNDSVERFTGMGVRVIQAAASFTAKDTVVAGDYRIKARRFIVATGSLPAIPPIPGLDRVPYFTNETVFDAREKMEHLIIIGGGPMGLELGQAFLRLGSRVTVIEAEQALAKDDPELTDLVLKRLRAEGLDIREGAKVDRVAGGTRLIDVHTTANGQAALVQGTHLLLATGRRPNTSGLNLEAAGIQHDNRGIKVNQRLMTTNSRVFAIGDVTGHAPFTHVANYHAGIVIRRALFHLPATADDTIIPWVTFTDPELAHVGLTEEAARKSLGRVNVYRWPYYENDRAQTERATDGFIKVVTDTRGRIKGASIVGAQAGELIQMWSLAISQGLNIKAMTEWISPYPTLSEINKRAAFGYYAAAASKPLVRKVIGWLTRFG